MTKNILGLIILVIAAALLRWYLLPTHLFFGPEQGRDFLAIKSIVTDHTPTLIGPKTDFSGIFHGPFYYYLVAIPFLISYGDPLFVIMFFTAIQAFTVVLAYGAGSEISGKRSIGLLSAILFTFSYGSIVYSRWLTGVPLTIPLSFAFLWLLFLYLHGKHVLLPFVAIIAAFLCQVEFINFLFVPVLTLFVGIRYYVVFKQTKRSTRISSFILFLVLSGGTYALFDVRHSFLITKSILSLFFTSSVQRMSLVESIQEVTKGFVQAVGSFAGIPNGWIAASVSIVIIVYLMLRSGTMEGSVLLVWLALPVILLLIFRKGTLEQLFVFTISAFLTGFALVLREIAHKIGRIPAIIILAGIVLFNVWQVWRNFPTNNNVFFQSTQPGVRYDDELRVVDSIYSKAGNKAFEIQAYTIPYFWQDAWTYLFWYRGNVRYKGKLPVGSGGDVLFVIIQKDRSNPTFQNNWYRDSVSHWGKLTDTSSIGEYTIEERVLKE